MLLSAIECYHHPNSIWVMIGLLLYGMSLYALNTYLCLNLSDWFCMSFYDNSVELFDKGKLQEFCKPGKIEEERGGEGTVLRGDDCPQEVEKSES